MPLLLISCSNSSKPHTDPFYTDKSDFDMSRVPLVKPYLVINIPPSNNWIIQTEDTDTSFCMGTIPGTKYINLVDSAIFAYSKNTIIDGQAAKEGWFVVVPQKHILRGFKTRKEYLNYLDTIKLKDPKMYRIEEVFHYFVDNDALDWKKLNRLY
ncbi:hypothetical protein AAFN85_08995 [Mucilaginibacter sp. CAU 1740]|uniref:hypothetical protein n=1 Tax=Mucilaginibacter sp. CAU 1740 TaxID=3140365 RepID=UPI00325A8C3D